ncbi:hypothetical protein IJ00_10625 [Calothrix sp. 336/3]|nr:hypothetical protein IJ00_10625 [Calothrix sp. 336/3]
MTAAFTVLTVSCGLLFSNSVGLAQTSNTKSRVMTKFVCVPLGDGYATIAQRGTRKTGPIITWSSQAFGPQYTPKVRCEAVSQRLTKAVAVSGGKLNSLRMTHGVVGASPVICYTRSQSETCNANNLLLTLNQSDRGKEAEILKQLSTFSVAGSGIPVSRSEKDGRTVVRIGLEIEQALTEDNISNPVKPAPQQ